VCPSRDAPHAAQVDTCVRKNDMEHCSRRLTMCCAPPGCRPSVAPRGFWELAYGNSPARSLAPYQALPVSACSSLAHSGLPNAVTPRRTRRAAPGRPAPPGQGCACPPARTAASRSPRAWRPSPAAQCRQSGPAGLPGRPGNLGRRHAHLLRDGDLPRQRAGHGTDTSGGCTTSRTCLSQSLGKVMVNSITWGLSGLDGGTPKTAAREILRRILGGTAGSRSWIHPAPQLLLAAWA
jgi:hypothetical protein